MNTYPEGINLPPDVVDLWDGHRADAAGLRIIRTRIELSGPEVVSELAGPIITSITTGPLFGNMQVMLNKHVHADMTEMHTDAPSFWQVHVSACHTLCRKRRRSLLNMVQFLIPKFRKEHLLVGNKNPKLSPRFYRFVIPRPPNITAGVQIALHGSRIHLQELRDVTKIMLLLSRIDCHELDRQQNLKEPHHDEPIRDDEPATAGQGHNGSVSG